MMFVRRHSQLRILTRRQFMSSTSSAQKAIDLNTHTQRIRTSKKEIQEMMAMWPDIFKDLVDIKQLSEIPQITKWITKSLNYNMTKGKFLRSVFMIESYKMLVPLNQLTEENLRLARILSWCIQLIQSHLILLDDVLDKSETRRGQTCWHHLNNIGLGTINDCIPFEHFAYKLLHMYFRNKSCYGNLVENMQRNVYLTTTGQVVDTKGLKTDDDNKINVSLCTMDYYNSVSKYKTSYATLVWPIRVAMHFAGINDPELHRHAEENLLKISNFYQVENDYEDCFGDSNVMGRIGSDIQKGKPTWFLTKALERATLEQKKILEKRYGEDNPVKVSKVKQVYSDMKLEKAYLDYKEERYNLLRTQFTRYPDSRLRDIYLYSLDYFYYRYL